MTLLTSGYCNLAGSYLFAEIARRVRAYAEAHPQAKLIRLGIGDVTSPLAESVITALHNAVREQATVEGFHGYGPEQGYDCLREAIVRDA